jgi:hypothetical protein
MRLSKSVTAVPGNLKHEVFDAKKTRSREA